MPDGTVYLLLMFLTGQSAVDDGHIGAVFSRQQDCETAKREDYAGKTKFHPESKDEFECVAWTLINTLDD